MERSIIEKAEKFVSLYYKDLGRIDELTYHNWEHTENVRRATRKIGVAEGLSEEELDILELAALFHDVEYVNGKEGHEQRSADTAVKFLKANELSRNRIEEVERLILVTEMSKKPASLDERVMKDADLAHLAREDYLKFYDGLKNELRRLDHQSLTEDEWRKMCIEFMSEHQYYTSYGLETLERKKQENIRTLKEMSTNEFQEDTIKAKKKKKKSDIPEKGIETMFRVSLRNHINLSRIADDKANTLISVNAIILSIVLSALFPKLDSNPFLIYPGFSLILVSIMTIILATLSTIPKTTHGQVTRPDVEQKKGNLLFFGNFHAMSLKDYEWGISELMKDRDYLYKTLTRDLFFLGKVLERKYGLLRYAYLIFVVGLIISILLFGWSILTLERPIDI